jgi:regulator of replication initiation timing
MKNIFAFEQYISSAKNFHFSLSSIDQIAHAVQMIKNKLSTIMNKLTTLKIDNIRLLKRIEKLKNKVEDIKNMKNVDAQIDYFNRDFSDELISHT